MDKYKKDLDRIHAPEALINSTLDKIHEAERSGAAEGTVSSGEAPEMGRFDAEMPARPRRRRRYFVPAGIAAAAAIILIAVFAVPRNSYTITEIPAVSATREISEGSSGTITESADQYSEFIGTDVTTIIKDAEFTGGTAVVQKDGSDVTDDLGIFYYTCEQTDCMLILSRTRDVTPDSMKNLETSRIGSRTTTLAKSGDGESTVYYASGRYDDLSYYLYCPGTDSDTFKKILKNFLQG